MENLNRRLEILFRHHVLSPGCITDSVTHEPLVYFFGLDHFENHAIEKKYQIQGALLRMNVLFRQKELLVS